MPRVLIAGLGLIGGSIGIRLRASGWRVAFVDPQVSPEAARGAEAADERWSTRDDGTYGTDGTNGSPPEGISPIGPIGPIGPIVSPGPPPDLIILATPVDIAVRILRTLRTPATVTSVCSVMAPLRDAATTRFIAGHPMAGSQERGLAAARADLFENHRWFVDADDPLVDSMIDACGAIRDRVDAREHDAGVALTSHLPQILSTALAAYLDEDQLRFAGSGLRTFLRLAGSDGSVWAPIVAANREQLARHAEELAKLVRAIIDGDVAAYDQARKLYDAL
ncbi:MAG TPA: prephenate dehydrogenase/arogenate dehydrogenase family protein [Thermoanaerobaculia bacterium]|jgi:prephenate dehydrogenase